MCAFSSWRLTFDLSGAVRRPLECCNGLSPHHSSIPRCRGFLSGRVVMKRIAVDLAKSVYPVAESVRFGQVVQHKRLNREALRRYIQEQAEPVEWVMEASGTAHYWGRLRNRWGIRSSCCIRVTCGPTRRTTLPGPYAGKADAVAALGLGNRGADRSQQSSSGPGQ